MIDKKVKVAFFSGPIHYSVCLVNALNKYCEITFFYKANHVNQGDASILNLLNPTIKKIPINTYRIRDVRNIWSYYKIARILNKFDIIHIQIGDIWFSLWRWLFKRVPIVFTVHDPYQHIGLREGASKYLDLAQKIAINQSSRFIVHGVKMKRLLVERYNLIPGNIKIIPHGEFSFYKKIRCKPMQINKKEEGIKRILFFGLIRKNKGLDYLIKAEPIISQNYKNFKIIIAGRFEDKFDYYNNLIQNKDKFEIIDRYIPNNQVADLFEMSDIVVLPYLTATQSGVLCLAFSFGKAVIATDTGSISELLEHGKSGLLVPPGDTKSLASAIIELLLDEKKCLFLGENAKKISEEKLNWNDIALRTVQLYKSVIKI